MKAGDARRDVEQRAAEQPPRGDERNEPDSGEEHLLARALLQPPAQVVAGDREAVDAAEAVQRDDRDRLAGDEQDEHPARLGTLLHAGTVPGCHLTCQCVRSRQIVRNRPATA